MSDPVTFGHRPFQLWEYRVSHGSMLVRSPRRADESTNIDIMFAGVEYVDLPRHLPELEMDTPKAEDVAFASERLGRGVSEDRVFVLKSQGHRYVVVAAAAKVERSEMDIFDSPF